MKLLSLLSIAFAGFAAANDPSLETITSKVFFDIEIEDTAGNVEPAGRIVMGLFGETVRDWNDCGCGIECVGAGFLLYVFLMFFV